MPVLTYLSFNGNCREALDFYLSVFGGEYVRIQTFGDGPPDMGVPDSDRGKIMHATLTVGDGVIMGSDMPSNFGPPPVAGNNFSLSYPTQSREETDELFAKMSEGRHGDHGDPGDVLGRLLRRLHGQVRHQLAVQLRDAQGVIQAVTTLVLSRRPCALAARYRCAQVYRSP